MKTPRPKSIVMVAGEASGDLHGARVIQALRKRHGGITVRGAGGHAMRRAGAEILVDVHALSVMGFTALFTKVPAILKAASTLKRLLSSSRPDLLVLIDFPDFNLHLAGHAKKNGIPVLYYISPQVWAWRANRINKIKSRVDHMAVILPFERAIYEAHGIPVTFVGHPLMDSAPPQSGADKRISGSQADMAISLLPGSRQAEVQRLVPAMLEAAGRLQMKWPAMRFFLSCAPTIDANLLKALAAPHPSLAVEITREPVTTLFSSSHLAIVASGTASLEAAIFGIPAIVVYATSRFNYAMAKRLLKVSHIGLANLIAQRTVMPELIQADASAEQIASTADDLLSNPEAYAQMQVDLVEVRKRLGRGGASDRVADIAGQLMLG